MITLPKITRGLVRRTLKEYLIISFGLTLYSFAWTTIIIPADLVGGGMAGLALVVYYATGGVSGGIPIGITFFVANALLLAIAAWLIGIRFGAKTLYAIFFISFSMGVMQQFVPPDLLGLAGDKLLSAILGGAVSGFGVSLCFAQGGSTGGSDIVAMIVNKYRNISYGCIIMLCDMVIIGSSVFVFKNITAAIYGYILVAIYGYTLDAVLAGNRQSSQMLIISSHFAKIAARVSSEMGRGVTLLDATGWYTQKAEKVIMVVCRKNETGHLFRIIRECDPGAFITVGSVMGVYGLGFESLKK